jgi:hypothetical protein
LKNHSEVLAAPLWLIIVISLFSISALGNPTLAAEHQIKVCHEDWSPFVGIEVFFFIQTGPDAEDPEDWTAEVKWTDINGSAFIDIPYHTNATIWYAAIPDGNYQEGDDSGPIQVTYPSLIKVFHAGN